MNNPVKNKEAEGIFKLQMKDFASASVSVFSINRSNLDIDLSEIICNSNTKTASSKTDSGETIHIKSTFFKHESDEWSIDESEEASAFITAICDLYPDAYVGNTSQQEIIISNFVSITRSLPMYLPDYVMDEFSTYAEEHMEDNGEEVEPDDSLIVYSSILTVFSTNQNDLEDTLAVNLAILVQFMDYEFIISFNFNRNLVVHDGKLSIEEKPLIFNGKKLSLEYLNVLLNNLLDGDCSLEEESTTYISTFNKNDYAPYNFIYTMDGLFISTIINHASTYRSLKPMDYFVVSDVLVNMESDVVLADNHSLVEFIENNNLDIDSTIAEELKEFGDGLLRIMVTFDKFDNLSDELQFVNTHLSEYSSKILDKYMGLTINNPKPRLLNEYVEDHYINLCKLVGNPNGLKERQFIDIEDATIVTTEHMFIRDITQIPLWVYLVGIPFVMYIINELDDEALIDLVEYDDSGIENHHKFMETVYMVKELLDKPWN